MENLPVYIGIAFGAITFISIYLLYRATPTSLWLVYGLGAWLLVQALVGASGFYTETHTLPPRFLLTIVPPTLLIIASFNLKKGKKFIDQLDLKWLTILHTIRIPVELALFWLYTYKTIPEIMTFEGRNLDILSGISAIGIYYLTFVRRVWVKPLLLIWNCVCIGLLINIVSIAILSAPFPFQKFGLDQPNIAILHFPFIWLPCCVVPIVLFAHLASIRLLINGAGNKSK